MRLLHTTSYFLWEFFDGHTPPYAILSHTWTEGEILYSDVSAGTYETKDQWSKVEGVCKSAQDDGHTLIWIDTCCT